MYKKTSWEFVTSTSIEIGVSPLSLLPFLSFGAGGGLLYVRDTASQTTHPLIFATVNAGVGVSVLPAAPTFSAAPWESGGSYIYTGPGANTAGSLSLNEFEGDCLILSGAFAAIGGASGSLIFLGLPGPYSNWGILGEAATSLLKAPAYLVGQGGAAELAEAHLMCTAVGFLAGLILQTNASAGVEVCKGMVRCKLGL